MKLVITSASSTKKKNLKNPLTNISAAKIHHQYQIGGKEPFMVIFSVILD